MSCAERTCTHCCGDGLARIGGKDVGPCPDCDGRGTFSKGADSEPVECKCKCNAVERRREGGSHTSIDIWVCRQCAARFARDDSVQPESGRYIVVEIPDHVEQANEAQARIAQLTLDLEREQGLLEKAYAELDSQWQCAQRADEYARGERDGLRWAICVLAPDDGKGGD